jgi:hypothetical protein
MQKFTDAVSKAYQFVKTWSKVIIIGAIVIGVLLILSKVGLKFSGIASFFRKFTQKPNAGKPEVATKVSETNQATTVNIEDMKFKSSADKTLQGIDSLLADMEKQK